MVQPLSRIGDGGCPFALKEFFMPRNQFQRMIFALVTVIITVHAYVFFSLYVINGNQFMQNAEGATGVLDAIDKMGGVPMFGTNLPIWAVILIEFAFAYALECVMGSPCSFKLASKVFDPRKTHPVMFETTIICATVGLMCPAMSLIAAFLYYPYAYQAFDLWTLLANWLKLVCFNFPFAFFTQLFFIQPFVRTVFKLLFRKDIKRRTLQQTGEPAPVGELALTEESAQAASSAPSNSED